MFVRKKKNKSGTYSIQVISNHFGKYKVIKSFGASDNNLVIKQLSNKANKFIKEYNSQLDLFEHQNIQHGPIIENFIHNLSNSQIRTVGPELIFGKIYDKIGYNNIKEKLLRHIVYC